MIAAIGCSSSDKTPTPKNESNSSPEPTAKSISPTQIPTPKVVPTAADTVSELDPTATSIPEPTSIPAPTATTAPKATVEPTATPIPTATATATPTVAPLTNVYNHHGFTVELDQDSSFASSNLSVVGWTESEPSDTQGLLTFTYNGADVVIFWQPHNGDSPQTTVDMTYQLQQLSKPDLNFVPLSQGDLAVDGTYGRFTGFLTSDAEGENASGGLIGAWTCADSSTQLSLTAMGPDSTALQIRFDRLTSGFSCATN